MSSALAVEGLTKSFNGVRVLDAIDLELKPGEIHGLIGENGAGKSTLVKVLAGAYTPDSGVGEIGGKPLNWPLTSPQRWGLAFVHQDLALDEDMTVLENIGVSLGFDTKLLMPYSKRREERVVRSLMQEFGVTIDPHAKVATLTPAERSLVAILRALRLIGRHTSSRVLVLDEPTAALSRSESDRLLATMRKLAGAGVALMFISHRLNEVREVCDEISVLRSGTMVGRVRGTETTNDELVRLMLGYELGAFYPDKSIVAGNAKALEIRNVTGTTVDDVSFSARRGEILGVTGLMGMGQEELPYLIFGHAQRADGNVLLDGKAIPPRIRESLRAGIVLVPGNRLRDSVWGAGTAAENLTLPFVRRFVRTGGLRLRSERKAAAVSMRDLGVRPVLPKRQVARFSGGNQQKIVLARWLSVKPKVLLLHEPTQGVDAGAKKEIFALIRKVALDGDVVLVFSSDIEEVANLCHRVIVLRHGRVARVLTESEVTENAIIAESQGLERPRVEGV